MNTINSQNKNEAWHEIDSLIGYGEPKSALEKINLQYQQATKQNDDVRIVRAVIYRAYCLNKIEGQNDVASITELRKQVNEQKNIAAKAVLNSMLGEKYFEYYNINRWKFRNRTELENDSSDDFETWSLNKILNECFAAYRQSLTPKDVLQGTSIDDFSEIVVGNKINRIYRPTLYDLLAQRAISTLGNSEVRITQPKETYSPDDKKLFTHNADEFVKIDITTSDSLSSSFFTLSTIQELTLLHLQRKNSLAVGNLTLQRLKYLKNNSTLEKRNELIKIALQHFTETSEINDVWFEAMYELAMIYDSENEHSEAIALCNKALSKPQINELQKSAFSNMIKNIKRPDLSVQIENFNTKNKPIKTLVQFKDIQTVYFRIYAINHKLLYDKAEEQKMYENYNKYFSESAKIIQNLEVAMPQTDDYKQHSTEVAINSLPSGQYCLIACDKPGFFDEDEKTITYNLFQVSSMSVVARNRIAGHKEFFVTDYVSGKPLQGVKFDIFSCNYDYEKRKTTTKKVGSTDSNNCGIADFAPSTKNLYQSYTEIKYNNETAYLTNSAYIGNHGYFQNPEQTQIYFFTDRAIYRPGQTLYFKGIVFDHKISTNTLKPNKEVTVELRDANDKIVSELKLSTNDYGTFSGNFVLPQFVLGGRFRLHTSIGDGFIIVEEYKRPTFEVKIDSLEKTPKFRDLVRVSGNAKAYSGYNIDNAEVEYNITRKFDFPYRWWLYKYDRSEKQIENGKTTTDENGNFTIEFTADDTGLTNDSQIAVYTISADVTDKNGETRSTQYEVRVSKKPLVISANIPENIDVDDKFEFDLTTKNLNGNFTPANVEIKISELESPQIPLRERAWDAPDKPILSYNEYKKLFPNDVYENENKPSNFAEKKVVKQISFNTNTQKEIDLSELKKFGAAYYKLTIKAENAEGIKVETTEYMQVTGKTAKITDMKNWVTKGKQSDKNIEFYVGGFENTYVLYEVIYRNNTIKSEIINVGTSPKRIIIDFPKTENEEEFFVQFSTMQNGRFYQSNETVNVRKAKKLDIKFVTFRDKMQPGEKEQWKLRIKSPNGEAATAEMVASLYDSSLDAFVQHGWNPSLSIPPLNYYQCRWDTHCTFGADYSKTLISTEYAKSINLSKSFENIISDGEIYKAGRKIRINENRGLMQVSESLVKGFVYDEDGEPIVGANIIIKEKQIGTTTDDNGSFTIKAKVGDMLAISYIGYKTIEVKVSKEMHNVILEEDDSQLDEAVVVGYGLRKAACLLGSVAAPHTRSINASMSKESAITFDYVAVDDDINEAGPYEEATTYASDTKSPTPQIRTNFNETAFFYSELRTDENGEIVIDFTIPESLTRWKMLGFAHTKNLETGNISTEVVTQKEIAISANAPRFLREGDIIELSAKVNNITSEKISGNAQLQLFDALTMKPIDIIKGSDSRSFTVEANQSKIVKWTLQIPDNVDAITYRATAVTDRHSDGEEKSLPILPNSMLVTESMPFTVRGKTTKNFTFDKMINTKSSTLKDYTYTIEFTSNPVWYAVQAIPYLMEYPYECSEQIFSRFYANSISKTIVDKFPQIERTFDMWKMANSQALLSNLEKNQELKNILIEETPWVRNAQNETEAKKRIALLFDLNKMQNEQTSALKKLKTRQLSNGGFSWFGGMCESPYITQHIAVSLEHLKRLDAINADCIDEVNKISFAAINYCDRRMFEIYNDLKKSKTDMNKYQPDGLMLQYLYLRSFIGMNNLNAEQIKAFDYFYGQLEKYWLREGLYQQAMIALTVGRLGNEELAKLILKSLKEHSKTTEEMGMFWESNRAGWFWYQSPIETQAILIEAFSEFGDDPKDVEEMKIWLLRNKQTNDWRTTKATSEAVYALLMQSDNYFNDDKLLQIKLDDKSLNELRIDDLKNSEAGTGYVKSTFVRKEIERNFGKINVMNPNKTIAWGAAYWQYFENLDKITTAETGIKIKRNYYIVEHTDSGEKLRSIGDKSKIKIGDRVRVRMELRADRDYEYVHLKDMRASGLEPVNVLSRSKYQDGLWYYECTKDAATNFFINYLPKGIYVFEYDLRANNAGDFSTGIATFQCMYAPEFSSHSSGIRIKIEE